MPNDTAPKTPPTGAPPPGSAPTSRGGSARNEPPRSPREPERRSGSGGWFRRARRPIIVGVVVVLAVGSAAYWWLNRGLVSTDDAFIDGDAAVLSPQVGGTVEHLLVTDNQRVKAGDLILEIDPSDYEAALASARANLDAALASEAQAQANLDLTKASTAATLAEAESGVELAKAGVPQAEAQLAAAGAEAERSAADAKRYAALSKSDFASRQTLDQAQTTARSDAERVLADTEAVNVAKAKIGQAEAELAQAGTAAQQIAVRQAELQSAGASVEAARAAVKTAELNLSYTMIYAPQDGYITKRQVNAGDVVQKNQTLATLVFGRPWVTANFKETQLDGMQPGQPVAIAIDAYPDVTFKGHVDSIMRGTGAQFSLLPPENATGNYVKVVQRVPVKILIDEPLDVGHVLGLGMSVVPTVDTRKPSADKAN
jgi:membrane fusion protein, multidrug efflux system